MTDADPPSAASLKGKGEVDHFVTRPDAVAEVRDLAASAAVLVHRSDLTWGPRFVPVTGFCDYEPETPKIQGSFCSGSSLGQGLGLTAGHCYNSSKECRESAWVFGYVGHSYDPLEIQPCRQVLLRRHDSEERDYAVARFENDGPLKASPARLARRPAVPDTVFYAGYPAGLPAVSTGRVFESTDLFLFVQTGFGKPGASGSPAFDLRTRLLVGVLVTMPRVLTGIRHDQTRCHVVDNDLGRISVPGSPENLVGLGDMVSRVTAPLAERIEALKAGRLRVVETPTADGSMPPCAPEVCAVSFDEPARIAALTVETSIRVDPRVPLPFLSLTHENEEGTTEIPLDNFIEATDDPAERFVFQSFFDAFTGRSLTGTWRVKVWGAVTPVTMFRDLRILALVEN